LKRLISLYQIHNAVGVEPLDARRFICGDPAAGLIGTVLGDATALLSWGEITARLIPASPAPHSVFKGRHVQIH
jgi:hypothetical protein